MTFTICHTAKLAMTSYQGLSNQLTAGVNVNVNVNVLRDRSFKRHKFAKTEKTAFTNATFFVFKSLIPQDSMCCENFGRFHRRKSKIITNKAIKW